MSNIYLIYLNYQCSPARVGQRRRARGVGLKTNLDRQFFEGTRGRMVALLRREGRTVEELAKAVGLTNIGVRAHLATLERVGVVRLGGTVPPASGGGKPAYVYELTSEAESLFPRAYEPVLGRLLDVLSEGLGPQESEALLRGVGRRMAEGRGPLQDGVWARTEEAVAVLNELGGLAELEERDGALYIRGYGCPLAAVTPDHPEACRMVETLIAELAGVSVRERCERGAKPRCCFEVTLAESAAAQE
jgi:predicted ArsR family transcriptional regulator